MNINDILPRPSALSIPLERGYKIEGAGYLQAPTNAMTVDVEDYFHVSAFEPYISRKNWDSLPCRIERNIGCILDLFAEHEVKATFFTLGWIAKRYPKLIRQIVDAGHELACHGFDHVRVNRQNPCEFYQDVSLSKQLLEDISGARVLGYRAPSYSIGAHNLWALSVLENLGFAYSSSIYPIKHDLYGMPEAPRFLFKPVEAKNFLEVPITTLKLFSQNIPCGGGGYFRLLPYKISKWAMQQVNAKERQPCVFYFHPWEIDEDQPRQTGIDFKTRIRHYLNISKMTPRLRRLLKDFKWNSMAHVFLARRMEG